MSRHGERNRADALADFRTEMATVVVALSGDFDKRIKELQALKKELGEHEQIVRTVEEAERIRQAANDHSAKVYAVIDDTKANIKLRSDAVEQREQQLRSVEQSLRAREEALMKSAEDLDVLSASFTAHVSKTEAVLRDRETKLLETEGEVAAHMAEVSELWSKLNERLQSLASV